MLSACEEGIPSELLMVDWVKDKILLSSGLSWIVLALLSAPTGLPGVFNLLFLSTIVHSPSLAPRMLVACVASFSPLNLKAIGDYTGDLTRSTALVRCLRSLCALLSDMLSTAEAASLLAHAFGANVSILLAFEALGYSAFWIVRFLRSSGHTA